MVVVVVVVAVFSFRGFSHLLCGATPSEKGSKEEGSKLPTSINNTSKIIVL
jgi:hypothetical protein